MGARIRTLQTFAADPAERFFRGRIEGRVAGPVLDVPTPRRAFTWQGDEGTLVLTAAGDMRVAGISVRVWDFAVSGYPVLYRWLRARRGQALNAAMHRSILGLVARIDQLLFLFDEADELLAAALQNPLAFQPNWREAGDAPDMEDEDAQTAT